MGREKSLNVAEIRKIKTLYQEGFYYNRKTMENNYKATLKLQLLREKEGVF